MKEKTVISSPLEEDMGIRSPEGVTSPDDIGLRLLGGGGVISLPLVGSGVSSVASSVENNKKM